MAYRRTQAIANVKVDARAPATLVRSASSFQVDLGRGAFDDISGFHRFGANEDLGNQLRDIWPGATTVDPYPWPQVALPLRIAAGGNNADSATGSGARSVGVQYLNEDWEVVTEILPTNGTGASSPTSQNAFRFIRAFVASAGTYGGFNAGQIDIEQTNGALLGRIRAEYGQTEQTQYTVPSGWYALLSRVTVSVEADRSADLFFWQRQNADVFTAPFGPRRLSLRLQGISGQQSVVYDFLGRFPPKTDIWWSGVTSNQSAEAIVDYDLTLVREEDIL